MKLVWTDSAWEDYLYWHKHNSDLLKRINALIKTALHRPLHGIGAPEKLKFNLTGCISRRINLEHRLVYRTERRKLIILQCRQHY
jgi:toxin YoeB